jgi:hypothetical protein
MARNLTYDGMLEHQKQLRDAALDAIPPYETIVASVPKKDKAGKIVLDDDGVPTLVEKRLLKRDVVGAEWADRLKPYEQRAHDRY